MRDGTGPLSRPRRRRPASGRARHPRPGAAGQIAPAPRAGAGRAGRVFGAPGIAAPTAAALASDGQDATVPVSDAPVLRLAGYEGPLDALLDQARAGRVDLQHLPLLAVVEQCVAAVDAALSALRQAAGDRDAGTIAGAATPGLATVPLQRLAEWIGMAAWLAWLRSRLLLPEHDPEARAARAEAEVFRRGLAQRAAVREAADWLDAQVQLGRDVFMGGAAPGGAQDDAERAAAELAALLGAYTRRIDPVPGQGAADASAYSPCPPRLWRVPHAVRRIEQWLGTVSDVGASAGVDLWVFLPGPAALAAAGLARDAVLDPALLDRSVVASTLVAGLELARQGRITLAQEEQLGAIIVRARHEPPPRSDADTGAALGHTSAVG